ncbi:alpha/beta fold hydrolase [Microbulbifer sp. JSM ZJ756]|uniref:alpha/beta fold hydrolase n=1 Tax=Microbulbifer sp. JSM ZJ756 TaxID=3376191 RepID=UPI0037AC7FCC
MAGTRKIIAGLAVLVAGLWLRTDALGQAAGAETCYLDGWRNPLRCYRLPIESEPEAPQLAVMVAPAVNNSGEEPLYLLAGGPGQAASDLAPLLNAFEPVNRERDIVMVDRRGAGRSGAFRCGIEDQRSLDLDAFARKLADCYLDRAEFAESLSSRQTVEDLEMVRSRLGHERIALWGGSWGTRTALLYQQWHPQSVSELVLDAVAPIDTKVFLTARAAEDALQALQRDCANDPACARLGNWRAQLDALLESWDQGGRPVLSDPLTGQPLTEPMARWEFANAIRTVLYDPRAAAQLPFAITEAHSGNLQPLVGLSGLFVKSTESMSMGLTFSVACAEELNRISADEIAADSDGTFLGTAFLDLFQHGCRGWPVKEKPYAAPEPRAQPVLLISGEADPITPPRYADEALGYLADKQHLVVASGGHINSPRGCIPELIARFLAQPAEELDSTCTREISRPPFMVASYGPDIGGTAGNPVKEPGTGGRHDSGEEAGE